MKKRILSIIVYITNLTLLCCPWIPLGVERYNYFQFITIAWSKNFQQLIIDAEIPTENMLNLIVGTRAELIIVGISVVFSIIYCILMILGKYRKVNFINTGCLLFVLMMHCSWETLANFCNSDLLGAFVPSFLFLSCLVECIFGYIFMEWDRIKEEVRRNKECEKALEREEKERLGFPGKYAKIFYKIVLKNFWKNCKDFVLLFICNVILFAFFAAGFGLKQILSVENTSKGTLVFNGLNQILVNAIIPMVIISVSVIIILLFYYLKCRARGYGLFMTLGMRKGLFYIFIGTELIACLILSLLFGSFCGKLLLSVLLKNSKEIIGVSLMATNISSMPYLQAVAILLLIYLFSFMAARDIFTDFNIGKSTDLRAIAEKIPNRFPNLIFTFAGMSCIYCMFRYSKRYNFENKSLMLVLFLGIFLAVRYGLCNWLLKERKKKGYLKKLMLHNQLLHRSRTSAGYIAVLSIVQFCILFYFSFQIFLAIIAEEPEKQFPYDFVCLADETNPMMNILRS